MRFIDIEPEGLGMAPDALKAILDNTADVKAVMPVHIGGIVAPSLATVLKECQARDIPVLEDAAHALGSKLNGEPAGGFGRFGAFSFYPTKVATSSEGGLLACARPEDLEQATRWRDHGKTPASPPRHDRPGGGWRMSELNAAVGITSLEQLPTALAQRRALADRYARLLADVPGIRPHLIPRDAESNFYKYFAYHHDPGGRADLKRRLIERHGIHLAGEMNADLLCDQPYFQDSSWYPCARWFAQCHVALPTYPSMTEAEQDRVVAALTAELT